MRKLVFAAQVLLIYLSMTTEPATEKVPVVVPLPAPDVGIFIDAPEPEGV